MGGALPTTPRTPTTKTAAPHQRTHQYNNNSSSHLVSETGVSPAAKSGSEHIHHYMTLLKKTGGSIAGGLHPWKDNKNPY